VTFRLLTFNICRGGVGRVEPISRIVASCAPDLVLLQEATVPEVVEHVAQQTGMAEWRSRRGHSLAFMSRARVAHAEWIRPRVSRHAFLEIVMAGDRLRIFGVHLSAVHAAWTERRRVYELRALLESVKRHQHGLHVLAGDFNTLAPDATLDVASLPWRLRPFVWLSGGSIRWRTIQTVLDAGYVDAFRLRNPADPGLTMPATAPHVRLDYVFVPESCGQRVGNCAVVRSEQASAASDHLPVVADFVL